MMTTPRALPNRHAAAASSSRSSLEGAERFGNHGHDDALRATFMEPCDFALQYFEVERFIGQPWRLKHGQHAAQFVGRSFERHDAESQDNDHCACFFRGGGATAWNREGPSVWHCWKPNTMRVSGEVPTMREAANSQAGSPVRVSVPWAASHTP